MGILQHIYELRDAFTWRFIIFLAIIQGLLKGLLYMTIAQSMFPIFKVLNVPAARLQIYTAFASAPWSLKPVIGVVSDLIAIRGYHKRYWALFGTIIGIVGSVLCVAQPTRSEIILVIGLCFINYQISSCDLLTEGKYAELIKTPAGKKTGSNIITLCNAYQKAGNLIAMLYVGPLADMGRFQPIYAISAVLTVTPVLPILLGWLPENKRRPHDEGTVTCARHAIMVDSSKARREWRILVFVSFVGVCGPIISSFMAFVPPQIEVMGRYIAIGCAALLLCIIVAGAFFVFDRAIARVTLYLVLAHISAINVGTAMDYFYTATPECLPNGPAFSYKYYITLTGILGSATALLTSLIYPFLFGKWRIRNALIFTTLLVAFGGVFDLIMVERWNLVLGVPDKIMYIAGEAILENVVGMLYWIPSSTIIAQSCPKGLEAATFAFLAGVSNFGGTLSTLTGAVIIDAAHIDTSNGHCDFQNLWLLIVIGRLILPVAIQIPASFLIPNKLQTESLIEEQPQEEQQQEEVELMPVNESDDDFS